MNYYEILKVNPNATKEEITLAHKRLAIKLHPDKNPGNISVENHFKQVNQAYSILNNPNEKAKYDSELRAKQTQYRERVKEPQKESPPQYNFSKENYKAPDTKRKQQEVNHTSTRYNSPSNSTTITISINFWDAILGNTVTVNYLYNGRQYITDLVLFKGVESGEKFQVQLDGQLVMLELYIIPDSIFHREGLNLYSAINVPFDIAMLGGDIVFPNYEEDLIVNVPKNSKNRDSIKLFSKGVVDINNNVGDLILFVNIVCPENLTDEQISLVKKISVIERKKEKGLYFFKTAPFIEAIRKKFIKV